LKYFFDMF